MLNNSIHAPDMRKLDKLKEWYSVEAAAKRLSETSGERVEVRDLLQLALNGQLPLSWYVHDERAKEVALHRPIPSLENYPGLLASETDEETYNRIKDVSALERVPVREEVVVLTGAYHLELNNSKNSKEYIFSIINNMVFHTWDPVGILVRDRAGTFWETLDSCEKLNELGPNIYPSVFINPAGLGFQRQDLEAFEARLRDRDPVSRDPDKPLSTKERETLLKLVIGMATKRYGYNSSSGRSDTVTRIVNDLATVGIKLDPDTVRSKLKEATQLLRLKPDEPEF